MKLRDTSLTAKEIPYPSMLDHACRRNRIYLHAADRIGHRLCHGVR